MSPQALPPGYPWAAPPGVPAAGGVYPSFPPPPRRATASTILTGTLDVWAKNFLNFFVVFFGLALANGLIAGLLALAILGTFASGSGLFPAVVWLHSPSEGSSRSTCQSG